jgi:hypothetical protein
MPKLAKIVFAMAFFSVGITARAQQCGAMAAWNCGTSTRTQATAKATGCLIVKHKGTVGRRLMWTALIGVPIAPGTKYDYVDSLQMASTKTSFKGKELQEMESQGTHVIVLNDHFQTSDLQAALESCKTSLGLTAAIAEKGGGL